MRGPFVVRPAGRLAFYRLKLTRKNVLHPDFFPNGAGRDQSLVPRLTVDHTASDRRASLVLLSRYAQNAIDLHLACIWTHICIVWLLIGDVSLRGCSMKTRLPAVITKLHGTYALCCLAALSFTGKVQCQGAFQNLGFESATLVPIPGDSYGRVQFAKAFPG